MTCVGLQVPAGLQWHDAHTIAILHNEEHECFIYFNKGPFHKYLCFINMPFLTILYDAGRFKKKKKKKLFWRFLLILAGSTIINTCGGLCRSDSPCGPSRLSAMVNGHLQYDCGVERMIGLLFVSWVQVFITFQLAHFCGDYSKIISIMLECFHLMLLKPNSAQSLTGSVARGHMSREWMKQDGLTPDEMTPPASSCLLHSFEVCLKSISTL